MDPRYLIIVSFVVSSSAQNLGENCTLKSGIKSQCKLISQCKRAINNLRRGVRPDHCGFQGQESIVCCQEYKSDEKCLQYYQRGFNASSQDIAEGNPALAPGAIYVSGGVAASAGEFPHMVSLGFGEKNDIQWLCGGSLISEKFVLTAAHCVEFNLRGLVKWVLAGTINLIYPFNKGRPQYFEVAERFSHPDYHPPSKYHDIALLELNSAAQFNYYVFPACVNTAFKTKEYFTALGWGRLQFLGNASDVLMKVNLQLFSNEECKQRFADVSTKQLSKGIDEDTLICAGGKSNVPRDTCEGDSGGPLIGGTRKLTYVYLHNIVGITSFGKGCGVAKLPAIYTRISDYIPWIENIVWP